MSEPRNEKTPTPPPRDLLREARRLERLRHLRLLPDAAHVDRIRPATDPKEAA